MFIVKEKVQKTHSEVWVHYKHKNYKNGIDGTVVIVGAMAKKANVQAQCIGKRAKGYTGLREFRRIILRQVKMPV